eukprot:SAG31_NODE_38741_length_293_cov_1.855670_1_plen_57_part_10
MGIRLRAKRASTQLNLVLERNRVTLIPYLDYFRKPAVRGGIRPRKWPSGMGSEKVRD